MPRMDGFQATRAIRAYELRLMSLEQDKGVKPRNPARIVALTGLSSASDEKEALDSGCDIFLVKPIKFANLERYLKDWGLVTA
jgi:CheY-like chemotaxis protein